MYEIFKISQLAEDGPTKFENISKFQIRISEKRGRHKRIIDRFVIDPGKILILDFPHDIKTFTITFGEKK